MATTKRDGIGGREKRVPSPANSNINLGQRSTKNSNSPSSGKQVPNYLNPATVTSRSEPSKNAKKPGIVSDKDRAAKAALNRRRSMDRPDPSATRANKSLISPGHKDNTPRTLQPVSSSKSSTFSPKPTVPKTGTGKPLMLSSSRSVKKPTTVVIIKKDAGSKKAPIASSTVHDTKQVIKVETKNEMDESSPVHGVEEVIKVENEVEAPEIPKSHIQKELDVVNAEVKDAKEVNKDIICDIAPVSEEQSLSQIDEIDEGILQGENFDPEDDREGEENAKSDGDSHEGIETEAAHKMEENVVDEKEGRNEEEENKEVDEGSQKLTEDVENKSVEESKPEAVNVVAKRQAAAVQGKKESPAAYNAVIEETASKLLEKRKNKVKALVGAFQTVIDYETAASK
ncbi:hypothetical protein SLEP1_g15412 [Rubroshorea leprosula]|uniref:Calmodulin-binding domain-containing protein n=1 Tax=Rubroshorea leprosula TaxID=152421 RepID=A0AAV5IWP3_9ROSI|nr:hypothetical protein SLEP1_g15412 [Rubroshorea leprosula]